jgi:succinate dehydrogenase/fumarate reductase flavoprotein subunit
LELGVTPYQQPVEIGVAALFMMGGIHINERCETSAPRLYAAGEVSGNAHGARRVSGNAFPEMIVFGARAGRFAAQEADKRGASPGAPEGQVRESMDYLSGLCEVKAGDIAPREMRRRIRWIMGKHAHVFRNGEGIKEALAQLQGLEKELPSVRIEPVGGSRYNLRLIEAIDVRWLLHAAQVVCRAALHREESRGFHFREDFPREREDWLRHTVVRRVGLEWVGDSKPIVM